VLDPLKARQALAEPPPKAPEAVKVLLAGKAQLVAWIAGEAAKAAEVSASQLVAETPKLVQELQVPSVLLPVLLLMLLSSGLEEQLRQKLATAVVEVMRSQEPDARQVRAASA